MEQKKSTNTDSMKIDLWLKEDVYFSIRGSVETIPRYTKCYKPPYTPKIRRYLSNMEFLEPDKVAKGDRAVCIYLLGMNRYLWRSNVLTEKEHERATSQDKNRLVNAFRKKSRGAVAKG